MENFGKICLNKPIIPLNIWMKIVFFLQICVNTECDAFSFWFSRHITIMRTEKKKFEDRKGSMELKGENSEKAHPGPCWLCVVHSTYIPNFNLLAQFGAVLCEEKTLKIRKIEQNSGLWGRRVQWSWKPRPTTKDNPRVSTERTYLILNSWFNLEKSYMRNNLKHTKIRAKPHIFEAVKRWNGAEKVETPLTPATSRAPNKCTYLILSFWLNLEGGYARNKLKKWAKNDQKTTFLRLWGNEMGLKSRDPVHQPCLGTLLNIPTWFQVSDSIWRGAMWRTNSKKWEKPTKKPFFWSCERKKWGWKV